MLKVTRTELNVLEMKTRMPFKYGIATLTRLPHLFVRVELDVDGKRQMGIAADGIPPKWFTKNPETKFSADAAEMFTVIRSVCSLALEAAPVKTPFELWEQIYKGQAKWAVPHNIPPLLANFGVSLVERALIDAFCRAKNVPFARAVRENQLGIELGRMRPELSGRTPAELLPAAALRSVHSRHTVGLADPLTAADLAPAERADDGLPQTLEENIDAYGLTHFKLKISGDAARDFSRLEQLADVLQERAPGFVYTMDGNEQYKTVESFRGFWESLQKNAALKPLLSRCLFVEQPLHRDVALSDATASAMLAWRDRPPTIIDESDADLTSLPRALASGYAGTSHKNCKGIFKSISNVCLLALKRRESPKTQFLLSGEDLCNIGPVALPQDLAVAATLGVEHVERNGHHYFAGLSMFPADIQDPMLKHHGDLFHRGARGFVTPLIRGGRLNLGSIVDAPFGVIPDINAAQFTPLEKYDPSNLA